ncbi:MAG: S8 family peptidase [Eubacterium sp.]|nr:S8 family peptidase [Eubacterium sp.]
MDSDILVKGCHKWHFKKKGNVTSKQNKDWNFQMINAEKSKVESEKALEEAKSENADEQLSSQDNAKKIKVAVLDSGVDYGNDIEVKESMNFVDDEEMSPLFVDDTGHGTSVAGIIAAEDNGNGITGINPNVELYSAKILNEDKAPIDRVVAGIEWAIEKEVNIINLSFSTPHNSKSLHDAIKKAYNKGILVIAAAGNEGEVEYPAAYEEVVAVGSVKSDGTVSENSAKGEELELVAPGDKIEASALLGGTAVVSGTSLAAPHVTAIASLLWEKDMSMPADFIRTLIDLSANKCDKETACGNGIVDYNYALEIYDEVKEEYNEKLDSDGGLAVPISSEDVTERTDVGAETASIENGDIPFEKIEENNIAIDSFDSNRLVEGKWEKHHDLAADYTNVKNFQQGARFPDDDEDFKYLGTNMAFHGGRFINTVAVYRYLNKVARAVNDLSEKVSKNDICKKIENVAKVDGMDDFDTKPMKDKTIKQLRIYGKNPENADKAPNVYRSMRYKLKTCMPEVLYGKTKRQKEAFMFGMASHTATDMYAHSTFRYLGKKGWRHINHDGPKNGIYYADNKDCIPRRINSAKHMLSKVVDRFENNRSKIDIIRDFAISKTSTKPNEREYYNARSIAFTKIEDTDATYRLYSFSQYMISAGESDKDHKDMYAAVSVYPQGTEWDTIK